MRRKTKKRLESQSVNTSRRYRGLSHFYGKPVLSQLMAAVACERLVKTA
jgi:hypothetical protein